MCRDDEGDRSQATSIADPDEGEEEDTVDPIEQQQEIWAASEGYTPLSDVNYTSLLVSMGPDDQSSDDEPDRLTNGSAALFVSPGPDSHDSTIVTEDEAHREVQLLGSTQRDTGSEFQDIASQALMVLDEEYNRTLNGTRIAMRGSEESVVPDDPQVHGTASSTVDQNQKDEDLLVIAEAFDRHFRENEQIQKQGGFPVDWDSIVLPPPAVSSTVKPPQVQVDTDAVRKVVASLSEKAEASFQQKFAVWQQRQTMPLSHEIIPPFPYKAFCRSTEKAKKATASLSRSASIAEAIVRIRDRKLLNCGNRLVVDVVGVDCVECESIERIQNTFRPIVRWLGVWTALEAKEIHLRLIGRDLTSSDSSPIDLLTPNVATNLSLAFATGHAGVYDEWLETESGDTSPDLVIAFNAGIWGYKEWIPTIRYINSRTSACCLVVSAYNMLECQEDHDAISEALYRSPVKALWGPEINPFGSNIVRETKSSSNEYRENAAWQAWLLGGHSSL